MTKTELIQYLRDEAKAIREQAERNASHLEKVATMYENGELGDNNPLLETATPTPDYGPPLTKISYLELRRIIVEILSANPEREHTISELYDEIRFTRNYDTKSTYIRKAVKELSVEGKILWTKGVKEIKVKAKLQVPPYQEEVKKLLRDVVTLAAVKYMKTQTDLGLRECKDYCDNLRIQFQIPNPNAL